MLGNNHKGLQTHIKKLLPVLALFILITACSRKNNTFINRNFHAVTAEYNTLYNGEVAFEEGRDALINSYDDNFWEILPVERMESFEEITLPGASKDPNFERAEEKAIKAIQKHSMEINGKEHNPQMDEAFMLLGKARYFDQRFVRALEAFNYILAYYPASNNIAQAKVWKAKTNIRLDNDVVAIENLKELLEEEELDKQDYADASAMLAQAYINRKKLDSAVIRISEAANFTRKSEEKGRFLYLKGQLFDALEKKDSANLAYDEVIALNRKSPRRYMINAYIAKAKNFDYENQDQTLFLEMLKDLEANRENRPYLDRIYNQLAEYYRNIGEGDSAIAYYNRSLRTATQDEYLTSKNYLSLGDFNFNKASYQLAGAYYDSTLTYLNDRSREHRRISKKRENLNEVILYERTASQNDSLLSLVAMTDDERRTYFQDYINKLIEKRKEDSIAVASGAIRNNEFFVATTTDPQQGSKFYFYNPTVVAQGKLRFDARWGNRELADNWRISSNRAALERNTAGITDTTAVAEEATTYNLDKYIETIPTDTAVIDSITRDRNYAYYQLGLIYKEKFRENDLAIARLETLLKNEPEDRLVLPANYYLYQLYKENGDTANSAKFKDNILTNYGDSRYAAIINNPDTVLSRDEESPETLYNNLYKLFEQQQYDTVIHEAGVYVDRFAGDEFVPKFELLKATAIGRYEGFESFEKALNYVALTYPNAEEGKKALNMLETVIPQIQSSDFRDEINAVKWKLIYTFPLTESEEIASADEKIKTFLEVNSYRDYTASVDVYDPERKLLVVHGFNSQGAALSFAERLKSAKDLKWNFNAETISSENYRIIQIHKNLDAYLTRDSN